MLDTVDFNFPEPNRPVLRARHKGVAGSLRFLRARWRDPIKVRDLVKASGMSRRGFFKAFTRHVGMMPKDALRNLRLEHARTLLAASNRRLSLVAQLCGYEKANSFLVAFKRETGLSPSQFRQRHRQSKRTARSAAAPR
ncbi:MAG: AraC family transcriptional regulator [Verrucomicrobia bacterium]|nr:MAG: AraC family transcriptional regulator [Verrucomicrobiota bacterium]